MAQEFSPQQLAKLLQQASERFHTTPEALIKAFRQGGLAGVAQQTGTSFSPAEAAKAENLLQQGDLTALLHEPQVRQLLNGLLGDG